MKTPLVLRDAPYGSERTDNGARRAGALSKQPGNEIRVFLMGDAASAAHAKQKVPSRLYNLEVMLDSVVVRHAGVIGVRGTCMDARGVAAEGFEKRFNPMLSMSREAFVDALTADVLPQPADMTRIVEANLRGGVPEVTQA